MLCMVVLLLSLWSILCIVFSFCFLFFESCDWIIVGICVCSDCLLIFVNVFCYFWVLMWRIGVIVFFLCVK